MPLQPAPETLQITTPSVDPVALNCISSPGFTDADEGDTVTAAEAIPAISNRASSNMFHAILGKRFIIPPVTALNWYLNFIPVEDHSSFF
jgi:hypothetical protein